MIKKSPIFSNKPNSSINLGGVTHWLSRHVACVGVVVAKYRDEYYVLLSKRGSKSFDYSGYWNLPCGYLDYNETIQECAVREIYEETGLFTPDIPTESIINNYMDFPYYINSDPSANRQNVSMYFGLVFESKYGLPELSDENSEDGEVEKLKWVNVRGELHTYTKFAFNHDVRINEFLKMVKIIK